MTDQSTQPENGMERLFGEFEMCIRDRLYLRYQINLTETRQKAAESADEMLARYARGEMLPDFPGESFSALPGVLP